jgi:hypothetical protein
LLSGGYGQATQLQPRSPRFAIGAVMVKRLSRNNIKGNPKRQENVNQFHFLDVFILPNLNFVEIFIKPVARLHPTIINQIL